MVLRKTPLKLMRHKTKKAKTIASDKIKHLITLAATAAHSGLENAKGKVVNISDFASTKAAQFQDALHDPKTEAILDDFIVNRAQTKKIIIDRLNRGECRERINAKLIFVLGHTGHRGKEMVVAILKAAGRKDPRSIIDAVRLGATFASTLLHLMEARKKHSA